MESKIFKIELKFEEPIEKRKVIKELSNLFDIFDLDLNKDILSFDKSDTEGLINNFVFKLLEKKSGKNFSIIKKPLK